MYDHCTQTKASVYVVMTTTAMTTFSEKNVVITKSYVITEFFWRGIALWDWTLGVNPKWAMFTLLIYNITNKPILIPFLCQINDIFVHPRIYTDMKLLRYKVSYSQLSAAKFSCIPIWRYEHERQAELVIKPCSFELVEK